MDEEETNTGSFSRKLFGNKDVLETENKSVSTSPERKKKSNDQVLVFGNSSSSSTKVGKSAIFEFGSSLCSITEKGLSDSYCEFDSDNSSMEVDALDVQKAINSAVNAVDEYLSDENEHQKDKCTNNGGENNSNNTLKINKMNTTENSSGKNGTEIKNLLVLTTEREENSLDTTQQNQNNIHDSSKSAVEVDVDQGLEFSSQGSQDSVVVIENNKTIDVSKTSVSHTTVEGKTSLETKQTSNANQDVLTDKDSEHLLKSKTDNIDDGSLDNENCSIINVSEDNVKDCSERETIHTKLSDLQNDQNTECKPIENIHVNEPLEDSTGSTHKMCNENSNNSFGGSKTCSEKKDDEITNTSKKNIQIIKDPSFGSTISVTLEDVEVSVFEGEPADKLPSQLNPVQKITENSSLNNNAENKDTEQLNLSDSETGSDQGASQDSIECDEFTMKENDSLIGDDQLNQGKGNADAGLEAMSRITAVTKPCDKNNRKPSTEGEESNPNTEEYVPSSTSECNNQDKTVPSQIVQKLQTQTDSSLDVNSTDAMEVDDEITDSSSIHKTVENSVVTSKEDGEEDSSKIATNSKTKESTAPDSDNDKDSRYELIDLESEIQSVLNKNMEFRKQMLSDTIEKEICEENNSTVNKESNEAEVICLFDDDDELSSIKKKPAAAIKCVNPNCMSGEGLDKPAMFVLSYFGLKHTKDQLVCEECFNMVCDHQEKLATMLKAGKPLFIADFPMHKDVILLDSDEECISDNESILSDDTMEVIRDNLDDVISESMAKYGLDHQIRESCHWLDNKIEAMEDEAKELDQRFDQVQKTLDEFRKQIYENFSHPIKEIEELHFTDCEIPPMPILKNKQQNQRYNMELMKILKKKDRDDGGGGQQLSSPGNSRTIATKKVSHKYQMSPQSDYSSQEVIALHSETRFDPPPNLPPEGPLRRPKLRVGDLVYTMKVSYFSIWVQSRVIEIIPRNPTENDPSTEAYRVRFEHMKKNTVRTVTGTYLAYSKPSPTQLRVGTRVIAIFKEEEDPPSERKNYYVGVIAEPPKRTNKYRYLVFFDDGYTQYCPHDNILVVCNSSKNVWEDIHPEPRDFIRNYIQQYPERPMVKLSQGQTVRVEWNGKWWLVRVLKVDASLVKVHFDADKRTEWIYRGSTRLSPMFKELAAAKGRQSSQGSLCRSRGFGGASKSDMPYVEYTRGDVEEERGDQEEEQEAVVPTRSVARKSTAKKPAEPVISNPVYAKPLVNQLPLGKLYERILKPLCKPRKFRAHQCGRQCVEWTNYSPAASKLYDPLIVPLMFGFARLNMVFRGKNIIVYRAPCGRSVRSQQEMLCYLQATKTDLTIDLFDFDFWVNPSKCFEEGKTFGRIEDLSYGKENVPISCVNELDHSMPQYVQYMTARQPAKDVNLNLDPEFLVGCNCTDDCEDRSKCSCWQLTMQGKAYVPDGELDPLFGYQYRRLPERIATGIYECNSRCKCSLTCQNRVAQQPLAFKLQLFKTLKKGWGIRCLHDIPRGSFICIYAGFLLTETEANEGGKTYGDEYLAELDYIESVEALKEGYESEAREMSDAEDENIEMMDIEYEQEQGLDSEGSNDAPSTSTSNRQEDIRLRLRRRTVDESDRDSTKKSKDDESISLSDEELRSVRQPQTFNASIRENEERESVFPSVRDLYGQDEQVFIMDAKTHGNIGRYLNHSCSPNVFVQNVFVDTHDLRFPWVAFFANQYVPAGTELTWDYNYDVGSVPGKVMLCYCGSPNCRGRLL